MARRTNSTNARRHVPKAFMQYLKFHRLNLGLTQAQLAKRAHITQSMLCDYETGAKKPRPKHHKALAEALGRPIEEFTAKLYGVNAQQMMGVGT